MLALIATSQKWVLSKFKHGVTEAAGYNSSSGGVATENCGEGGLDVGFIQNGTWLEYNQMNLNGQTSFQARSGQRRCQGHPNPSGWHEWNLDWDTVPVTGSWQTWTTLNNMSGAAYHNVYLVFTGGSGYLFNLEWFAFQPQANGIEAARYNSSSVGVQTENCNEGGLDVGLFKIAPGLNNQLNLNGQTSFQARVASAGAGGSIQIRLDGTNGTLIGTCTVPVTGGWQTWTTVNCSAAVAAVIITSIWCSLEAANICSIWNGSAL